MKPGDFVTVNDVTGCVRCLNPLTVLYQSGEERAPQAEAYTVITRQHCALLLAEKALRRIGNVNT